LDAQSKSASGVDVQSGSAIIGLMELPPPIPLPRLSAEELRDLRFAKSLLENPALAARLAGLLGTPIEKGFELLPKGWSASVNRATKLALLKALELAMATMRDRHRKNSSEFLHKVLVGASGGIGGAFGVAALPVELPVSTAVMLRSIADIARSEGHSLQTLHTKLACLEVFALGGRPMAGDAAQSSYWAVRAVLAKAIAEAASYVAEKGVIEKSAPAIVRLIATIASRFGAVVSEQVAAKAVPVVGAVGGSIVNVLFMNHFQDMARGHFIVKRLEAKYGPETVKGVYLALVVDR
jgi:hypothetical protein